MEICVHPEQDYWRYLCVCVCVCRRERKKERESGTKRERDRETGWFIWEDKLAAVRSSLWASSVRPEGPRFSPDNGVSLTGTQAANGSEIHPKRDGLSHLDTPAHSSLDTRSNQKNLRHSLLTKRKYYRAQTTTTISVWQLESCLLYTLSLSISKD